VRAVFVTDCQTHRILDADAVAEDILIPQVTVFLFRLEVKVLERFPVLQVQGKWIVLGLGRTGAAHIGMKFSSALGIDFSVKGEANPTLAPHSAKG